MDKEELKFQIMQNLGGPTRVTTIEKNLLRYLVGSPPEQDFLKALAELEAEGKIQYLDDSGMELGTNPRKSEVFVARNP